jgi:hypothetical protein
MVYACHTGRRAKFVDQFGALIVSFGARVNLC